MGARVSISGHVVLVTGGGSGIGRGSALAFADAGATVSVVDRDEAAAQDTVDRIIAAGGTAAAVTADVSIAGDCDAAVAATVGQWGRLDTLFHAAGVQFQQTLVTETTDDEWMRFIGTNLNGTFFMCRAAVPALMDAGGGTITLMASGRAVIGSPRTAAYAASKGGVVSFMRSLAWEVGQYGINVNCINPGLTDTDGTRRFQRDVLGEEPAEVVQRFGQSDPMGRISTPEDVASMVVFLSTAGRWITGQLHTLRVYTW
jgi:NAD(P)-dependent dehydrogenase (short-subunit alcohol dehydrogenase family)